MQTNAVVEYDSHDIFWKDFVDLPNNPYKLAEPLTDFKCLLVFLTNSGDYSRSDVPMPFGYMASLTRMNGGSASMLIHNVEEGYDESFNGYDMVCFYPMAAMLKKTLSFAKMLREKQPETKICLFNSDQHQHEMILCNPDSLEYAQVLMKNCNAIDYILVGEAEASFIQLCEKVHKKDKDMKTIPSCVYRKDNTVVVSEEPIQPVDFTFLPYAARDFLEQTIVNGVNTFSPRIQSSRGCLARCTYCVEGTSNITKGGRKMPVIQRNIIRLVDEIEMLYKEYNVIFFNVIDSSFEDLGIIGIERMKAFFEELKKRDLHVSFKLHFRMETFNKVDAEFVKKLKEAGGDVLIVGVESMVERELDTYKKLAKIEDHEKNLKMLDEFDKFFILIGHMMFSACLRLEDLPEKLKSMKEFDRTWDYLVMSNNVLVYRGTMYHQMLQEKGLILDAEETSPIIPYRYEDERVRDVASAMSGLKVKCPEVASLHNLYYDAMNIIARYYNPMNKHLWKREDAFVQFRKELNVLLRETSEVYEVYFTALIKLAEEGWSAEKAQALYEQHIPHFFPKKHDEMESVMNKLLQTFEDDGLSTGRLHLKTWLSIANAQVNTSGGLIEK